MRSQTATAHYKTLFLYEGLLLHHLQKLVIHSQKALHKALGLRQISSTSGWLAAAAQRASLSGLGLCGLPAGILRIMAISAGSIAPRIDKVPSTLQSLFINTPAFTRELTAWSLAGSAPKVWNSTTFLPCKFSKYFFIFAFGAPLSTQYPATTTAKSSAAGAASTCASTQRSPAASAKPWQPFPYYRFCCHKRLKCPA